MATKQQPRTASGDGFRPNALLRRVVNRIISTARSGMFGRRSALQYGTQRDMYDILGYDDLIEFSDFLGKYNRQDVGGKIVDAPPRATWRKPPTITESDGSTESRFIEEWTELQKRLRLFPAFSRIDRLAGIGHYAILLIGVKGDGELNTPMPRGTGPDDVTFTAGFHEGRAQIIQFERNTSDPRFGLPAMYRVELTSEVREQAGAEAGVRAITSKVHWSRVIHVAEDTVEDRVFGRPRLERVYNRLDDLMKISGGSAEMFWQNVARLWWLNIGADTEIENEDQLEQLEEDLFDALQGLRRTMQTQGVDKLEAIGGESPAPKETFDVLKELIASGAEIPQRILFGSERGELASTQDEANWLGGIADRQRNFAEPVIIRGTIDRLMEFGYLTAPSTQSYLVDWPNPFQLSRQQKAEAAKDFAAAIKAAAPFEDPTALVPVHEFRERFLDLPPEAPPAPTEEAGRTNILRAQQVGEFPGIDEFWVTVHRVADGLEPEIRFAFLDAIDEVREGIAIGTLERLIVGGEIGAIADAIPMGLFEQRFGREAGPLLQSAFVRVADLAAREVSGQLGLDFVFDTTDPRALRVIAERGAAFVVEVSTETRLAIRDLTERAFTEGLTPNELARRIRSHIGLTRFQTRAVDRFRAQLVEAGVSGRNLESMVGDFLDAKIRERAAVIARQETISAANAGQFELFKQVERSELVQNVVKEWIVTPDDRLCPICRPMAGQRVSVDEAFVSPFNGARAVHPPIHIQCRCAVSLVFKRRPDEE